MKVLITAGAGYIGSVLAEQLPRAQRAGSCSRRLLHGDHYRFNLPSRGE